MAKILVTDDDPAMVAVLSEMLTQSGHQVIPAGSADRGFELVKEQSPDLAIVDIEMPEGKPTGLELLQQIKEYNRNLPVLMITGYATKQRVVTALRAGAQDFIEKPFRLDELTKRIETALFQQRAVQALQENVQLKKQLRDRFSFDNLIGQSPVMQSVYRMIERVADTDATVLILGESGTGKELVARALHYNSRRAAMPFVAVSCSALPEHLLESELFGHRRGAFTGAAFDKVGLFQHADGGTIFLDEIGTMATGLQSKLLRFLQDRQLRRVGDTELIKVDVRVVAATNEPLQQRLREKTFREDLYYRISVIPIELPPLRDRAEDIPLLVAHFLQTISEAQGRKPPAMPDMVLEALKACPWPGNVRELQNALERACALCDAGVIELKDLPERMQGMGTGRKTTPISEAGVGMSPSALSQTPMSELADKSAGAAQCGRGFPQVQLKEFLRRQEVQYIEQAIRMTGGSKEKAAEMLGISMATLYRKLSPDTAGETDGIGSNDLGADVERR
ncbi:MAG: sigma-54 dependent transcriptional regulator [Verrucomicrobiia bacterium]